MLYGENTGPAFNHSLCPSFYLRRTGLTGIINFYILILYFSVHFIKNAYILLFYQCYTVQSSDIIYKFASGD